MNQSKFIWKYVNSKQPPSINDEFEKSNVYMSTFFHDDKKLNLPSKRTDYGLSSLFYSGVKVWNTFLNRDIRTVTSLNSLKKQTKTLLVNSL